MSSVNPSSTTIQQQHHQQHSEDRQQERQDNMTRGQSSLFVETRQSDPLEITMSSKHQILHESSMSNLVINNDVLTGSTEVQLMKHHHLDMSSKETTPPTSPLGRKSIFPESPSSASSPDCIGNISKCCQKRGRFLVWPVSAVIPTPDGITSSPRETTSSSTTSTN
jgi:hypothetical protein